MKHACSLVAAWLLFAPGAFAAAPRTEISDPKVMEEAETQGIRFPGCELLSTRGVINDLSKQMQILQSELSYLHADSRKMYEEWQGLEGGGNRSLRGERASPWHLYTRVNRLAQTLKSAAGDIQKHEASWWKLREALQEEGGALGDVQRTAGGFDALKSGLRKIVDQIKAVDIEIEKLQEDFDYVQPGVYAYLTKAFPKAGAVLNEPWHRQYEYQGVPRPRQEYDFDEVYARYMREAHESLHTSWDKPKPRARASSR